ncbi:MAG: putative RNA methyltransferase [Halomonas sp.]|uniref:putative RNA methyltransferase n=1 Tax=Halomonas sp. TaxID=1486246 RepID=UPI003F90021F
MSERHHLEGLKQHSVTSDTANTPFTALACPLDGSPLQRNEGSWRCDAGHSFDIARQGYVNLLPVQHKRSGDPGDSKAMVVARQRFLASDYYRPVAEVVSRLVLEGATSHKPLSCLDAGCGEGYYLRALVSAASGRQVLELMGLDISKWAILAAAKQQKRTSWVVGSNANLPVQAGTLDRLLCMFGFPVYHEFARVLKPGGLLLKVDAGSDHLRELREIIYPELKPECMAEAPVPDGFTHLATDRVHYRIELADARQIADLLAMTPHLYRAKAEGRERAAALESLSVSVDVRLTRLIRSA